jgi:NADPH-dependent 2,4-dienoyl-CoA reductase/sulfur reductase-like enzyme/rhodanese-related sulfurtransferase
VHIIMLERGPYVSFANCGLPYFIGGVIEDEAKLLIADEALFRDKFNVDVRTGNEAVAIDTASHRLAVRRLSDGTTYTLNYDKLVLSPGARPIRPPLSGIDLPGVFSLRTVPDSRRVREWIERHDVRKATVIGGGFIGLEMVENLAHRGIEVTVIERQSQLMPPLDAEMTIPLAHELEERGIKLHLSDSVARFEARNGSLCVHTEGGAELVADLVILAIGVQPESELAQAAGLATGPRGHILVDGNLRTSDPNVFAIGDTIEVRHVVTGGRTALPLAGPANRQGRIVADMIAGRGRYFRGVQGTAVCGVFDLTLAMTGASEKMLSDTETDYGVVYAHPNDHVGYYPGANPIFIKLTYDKSNGRVLGAQAVGRSGVARRIDVIAMAIQMKATVFDLEESELGYAPQYGAAKDPVNMIGMIASNVMRGDLRITPWQEVGHNGAVVLDVRDDDEVSCKPIPGEVHIPLNQLRGRMHELPKDRPIQICCAVGARAYTASRLLTQHGFNASLLSGGAETWFCVGTAHS